ncbi:MAG: hypothetical protein ACI8S6_004218, partial [Myxococcota bacterium]
APPEELGGDPAAGSRPLVMRARAGECVRVTLHNSLDAARLDSANASAQIGLRPQRISLDVTDNSGFNAGQNPLQTVAPGSTIVYTWYAGASDRQPDGTIRRTPIELGAINLTPPDPAGQIPLGLVGALVIEPARSTWKVIADDRTHARVTTEDGRVFEEVVLVHTDNLAPPEGCGQQTVAAISYTSAPSCSGTPDLRAPPSPISVYAGTPLRLRLLHPGVIGDAQLALHGHAWSNDAYTEDASALKIEPVARVGRLSTEGAGAHHEVIIPSAGGTYEVNGDYLLHMGDPADGAWTVLRTYSDDD